MPLPALNKRHKAGLFLVLVAGGVSLLLEASAKQTAGAVVLGIAAAWALGSLSLQTLGFLSCSLICAAGLGVLGTPLWQDWNSYKASVSDYDLTIAELREAVAHPDTLSADFFDKTPTGRTQTDMTLPPDFIPDRYSDLPQGAQVVAPKSKSDKDDWIYLSPPVSKGTRNVLRGESNAVGPTKTVVLPERAQKWKRPSVKESAASFPKETPDETALRSIERDFLLPGPTFSLRGSFRLHLLAVLIGFALAAAGFSGCGWYIGVTVRAKRKQAATV